MKRKNLSIVSIIAFFRRKPRYVPAHLRPWTELNYAVVAMHMYEAMSRGALS